MCLSLLRLPEQMEYPSECVEICGIVRLRLYCLAAHLERFAELLALQTQIIGIIVQHIDIVRVDLQRLFVCLICLLRLSKNMVDIAFGRPGPQDCRAVRRRHLKHLVTYLKHLVIILQIIIPHARHLQKRCL